MSDLHHVNLEEELLEHYLRCKKASEDALTGLAFGESPGAAGTLLNATTSALKEVVKMQTELYNAERVKLLERAMVETLKQAADADTLLAVFESLVNELEDE